MNSAIGNALQLMLESGPRTLGFIRIVIATQALWILLSRDPAGIAALPDILSERVSQASRYRFLLTQTPALEAVLWACAVISLTCVLFGWRTRVFGLISSLLLYHLAPLQSFAPEGGAWGKGLTIATLALPILACAPCEDRYSVQALRGHVMERSSISYGWAVVLIRFLFAQLYFFSGLAKLVRYGVGWMSAETIQIQLLLSSVVAPIPSPALNEWVAARPVLCFLLAVGTVALELLFVLAVFSRTVRLPLAAAAFSFHLGLWLTMGLRFLNLPHLLMFLDLDQRRADSVGPDR